MKKLYNDTPFMNKKKGESTEELQTKVGTLESSLAKSAKESQIALYAKLEKHKKKLSFPTGWTWTTAPINIYKNPTGKITTDFDVATYEYLGAGKTYYVSLTGSSGNDGLTPETPLLTIWAALGKPDVDRVIVKGGYYPRANGFASIAINRSVSIKAMTGEKVTISNSEDLTWTKTAGKTNVYQATRSAVKRVYDKTILDEFGDYKELQNVVSIDLVDSTQGSYFSDGTLVYVHTPNSRASDNNIRVMLFADNLVFNAETLYLEGLDIEGGKQCLRSENPNNFPNNAVYGKNCTFKYASDGNSVHVWGAKQSFFQKCVASRSYQDGFNYHIFHTIKPRVIEVDCIGRHNGRTGADSSNNGSSVHDGGTVIRVNGEYFGNEGANVIDVNEGTQSWNIGVFSHESIATIGSVLNADFVASNTGQTKMWLDSCVSFGSSYSLVVSGTNSIAYVNNNLLLSPDNINASGLKESYAS
jgi:hypothetical protein